MFGYAGNSEADLLSLYAGLKRSCENDPALPGIAPGCSRHCHGWGYVIHADNGLFHYRTKTSIYEDDAALPRLEGDIRAIFHGRFAGDPTLEGHIFSHPFVATTDREVIFLAHNGGVKPDQALDRMVDTEWALEQVIQAGGLEKALPKLKEATASALNLLVLTIDRSAGTPSKVHCLNYFKSTEKPKLEYYEMFLAAMPGGVAYVSSTFKHYAEKVHGIAITGPATFGELFTLEP